MLEMLLSDGNMIRLVKVLMLARGVAVGTMTLMLAVDAVGMVMVPVEEVVMVMVFALSVVLEEPVFGITGTLEVLSQDFP